MPLFGVLARSLAMMMADPRIKANGVRYGYRLVSGAQAGRSSSRRLPAPLRFVAGHRSALGLTSPFVSRAVDPGAGRLPATATTLREEWPPALPGSTGFDQRFHSYRPACATSRQTPGGPPRSRRA